MQLCIPVELALMSALSIGALNDVECDRNDRGGDCRTTPLTHTTQVHDRRAMRPLESFRSSRASNVFIVSCNTYVFPAAWMHM